MRSIIAVTDSTYKKTEIITLEKKKQRKTLPLKNKTIGGRSQDGGGIGRVITFSSTNSLKEQQNGEQSLQNNF